MRKQMRETQKHENKRTCAVMPQSAAGQLWGRAIVLGQRNDVAT